MRWLLLFIACLLAVPAFGADMDVRILPFGVLDIQIASLTVPATSPYKGYLGFERISGEVRIFVDERDAFVYFHDPISAEARGTWDASARQFKIDNQEWVSFPVRADSICVENTEGNAMIAYIIIYPHGEAPFRP